MIPRFRPTVGLAEFLAMARVWESDSVARHEALFAQAVGQAHAIAFPYGRTALRLLLETWGLDGAQIICPAYTCVVVPHAIVSAGGHPVFVDCCEDGNMDLDAVERAITSRTRAIVATSIFGHAVDLDRLDALRARHPDIIIIQDCAHSYTCEWRGRPVPAAGHAAIFGCNISKIATSIFGGMVTTDDPSLAEALRAQRDRRLTRPTASRALARGLYLAAATAAFSPPLYGLVDRLRRTGVLSSFEDYYDQDVIDMPADHLVGMTATEARVGAVQDRQLGAFIAARRRAADAYRAALGDLPGLRFLPAPPGASYSHIVATVASPRDLIAQARQAGVELGRIIDYVCPDMPCYQRRAVGRHWPMARHLAEHVINLPVSGRFSATASADIVARLRPILEVAPAAPDFPVT